MPRILPILAAILSLTAPPALAQGHTGHHAPAVSPYAGLEPREIKALSAQQIADLREGRGMSLALAAELNGYPGPLHVLELADALGLSDGQRERTRALIEAMRKEAAVLGGRLIDEEAALDRLFRERTVTPVALESATRRIGATQAELRAAHLRYHLEMTDLLGVDQVAAYQVKRGYRTSSP